MNQQCTRRRFLKTAAVGTAVATLAPELLSGGLTLQAAEDVSRVILAAHSRFADTNEKVNLNIARVLLEDALQAFTNTTSIRDAWMRIFPNLQSTDVIGLKVNCINRRLSSHPEVTYAITKSLIAALDMNPNNLIIWDRTSRELQRARYNLNAGAKDVRCLATSDGIGYDKGASVEIGNGKRVRLSTVLTEMCTYLINVPVLKDHSIAGVTLSLKNHYGSIDKPTRGHGSSGDPYIANLNAAPAIRDKTRLIVCDAAFGIYRGGPHGAPQWMNGQLLVTTDPVALDTIGAGLIDQQRRENGMAAASKRAGYLRTAAALGLGIADEGRIEAMTMELG